MFYFSKIVLLHQGCTISFKADRRPSRGFIIWCRNCHRSYHDTTYCKKFTVFWSILRKPFSGGENRRCFSAPTPSLPSLAFTSATENGSQTSRRSCASFLGQLQHSQHFGRWAEGDDAYRRRRAVARQPPVHRGQQRGVAGSGPLWCVSCGSAHYLVARYSNLPPLTPHPSPHKYACAH